MRVEAVDLDELYMCDMLPRNFTLHLVNNGQITSINNIDVLAFQAYTTATKRYAVISCKLSAENRAKIIADYEEYQLIAEMYINKDGEETDYKYKFEQSFTNCVIKSSNNVYYTITLSSNI